MTNTQRIEIVVGETVLAAELNDSETSRQIASALPITATGNRWGDEIYFSIAVRCPAADDARAEFAVGELGYWPPGNAFCIFFGPTPASTDQTPLMADPGNPIGRIVGDVAPLKATKSNVPVTIRKA